MAKKDTRTSLLEFLADKKKMNIRKIRVWARQNNCTKKEVENLAAEFAMRYAAFVLGGRSQGISPKDLIAEEEAAGIEVEYEHTPFQDDARKIAWDHLAEVKHYYTMLKHGEEMLDEMGDESKAPEVKLRKIKSKSISKRDK